MSTRILYSRQGAALGNNVYPTTLLPSETQLYAGAVPSWPFVARATRAAAGVTVKLKAQGTMDPPPAQIAAVGGSLSITTLVPGTLLRIVQGSAQVFSHTTSGLLVVVSLPMAPGSRPAGTLTGLGTYLGTTLGMTFTPQLEGSGDGLVGATYQDLPIPVAQRWVDLRSLRQSNGDEQVEHTLDAGVNATASWGFVIRELLGWASARVIGTATAAPDPDDALTIYTALPGGRMEQ